MKSAVGLVLFLSESRHSISLNATKCMGSAYLAAKTLETAQSTGVCLESIRAVPGQGRPGRWNIVYPLGKWPSTKAPCSTSFNTPSPSLISVTIHEAGGAAYTVHHAWPPDDRSAANIAEFIARKIWEAYAAHAGHVFDGVTVEFSTSG